MRPCQKIYYLVAYYDFEVGNGGICQYFVNSSKVFAPYLSIALEKIGATEHKALFEKFVKDNGIDLNDLSSFDVEDENDYVQQTKRYDFDSYDDEFCELKPCENYLVEFARKNISEIWFI